MKSSPFFFRATIILTLVAVLASACAPALPLSKAQGPLSAWTLADLHWLSAPSAATGSSAPVAFYFRHQGSQLEFRLDLLDWSDPLAYDLSIALDTRPGGTRSLPGGESAALDWDQLLVFPAKASPYALLPDQKIDPKVLPRILRDPSLGSLVVQVNTRNLPGDLNHLHAQAFISDGQNATATAGPAGTADHVSRPAPLLLEFWNTLPAASPAQALRRWDGAHTGPSGQRHGLAVLLEAAQRWQVPLFLLDLKTPSSLQALDLLGGARTLQDLERQGLVTLPQVAYGDAASTAESLQASQKASAGHGFQVIPIAFGPFEPNLPASVSTFFTDGIDRSHIWNWGSKRLVPLPYSIYAPPAELPLAQQVSPQGLAPELKRALLQAALSGDSGTLVVAGGDLATSPWADFESAGPLMEYLAATPWIQVLDQATLARLPASTATDWPGCRDLLCSPVTIDIYPFRQDGTASYDISYYEDKIITSLKTLRQSALADLAWEAYFNLSRPAASQDETILRGNYIGQTGYLVAAAQWAANPTLQSDCQADLDLDGAPECILSTPQVFAILQPSSGCLALLAENTTGYAQPWMMPTALVAAGLSDPSTWQLKKGPLADPDVLQGAFCNPAGSQPSRLAESAPGRISLLRPDGSRLEFTAQGATFRVQLTAVEDQNLTLPLYLGFPQPEALAYPLPALISTGAGGIITIRAPQGTFDLQITPAPISLQAASSFDTLAILTQPEIPDRSNPPGHYLPFPMAIAIFTANGPISFEFQFSP